MTEYILNEIPKFGGANSLNSNQVHYSQLELLSAQVTCAGMMLDLGLFSSGFIPADDEARDEEEEGTNLSQANQLFQALFLIIDPEGFLPLDATTRPALMLLQIRSQALQLMNRLIDLRSNTRISMSVSAYMRIHRDMDARGLTKDREAISNSILDYQRDMDRLERKMFRSNVFSSGKYQSDTYEWGEYHRDETARVMMSLARFKDSEIRKHALLLLMRNMTQRSRSLTSLQCITFAIDAAAWRCYDRTEEFIRQISSLKTKIYLGKECSCFEAQRGLSRLIELLVPRDDTTDHDCRYDIAQNQDIMLNLELDRSLILLLQLPLARDRSQRDQGLLEPDIATDAPRRELFQTIYTLLRKMAYKCPRAQISLSEHMDTFIGHMGVANLVTL